MALWKETEKPGAPPVPNIPPPMAAREPDRQSAPPPPARPVADTQVKAPRMEQKESVIAAGLAIEGKIEGAGHVRIAGNFTGDVHVEGNLTIEPGAKLTGGVRAKTVTVGGELEGNIDAASAVELASTGVMNGDLKAGTLTVSAGSRMRGRVEFGWDATGAGAKSGSGKEGSGA
jgi:cytoskeletal protein CcmA (bactofilin family)